MDLKKIAVFCMSAVLGAVLFMTSFTFLFHRDNEGTLFSKAGEHAADTGIRVIDTRVDEMVEDIQNTPAPEVKYTGGTQSIGSTVNIKSLLSVKTADSGSFVNGSMEADFRVYVINVLDENGDAVGTLENSDQDVSDEVVSPAYFDEANSTVVFNETGVFRISIKVQGKNGRTTMAELKVPVEG